MDGLIIPPPVSHIMFMTQWKSTSEPKKTKAELYEMLAEAVRNTAQPPKPKRLPKAKRGATRAQELPTSAG